VLIRGEALMHSFTLEYSAHGEAGLWDVSVKSPGCAPLQRQTYDETPYKLLDQMLTAAFESSCRVFPERAPPKPRPSPLSLLKRGASSQRRASR